MPVRAPEVANLQSDLASLAAPPCPSLVDGRALSPAPAQPADPGRRPGKCDCTIYHVIAQCARRLREDAELAWHDYVSTREQGAEDYPEGITPSLDPKGWTRAACAAFLKVICDAAVPEDGVPAELPWDGRRVALAHVVSYLARRRGRAGGRADLAKT